MCLTHISFISLIPLFVTKYGFSRCTIEVLLRKLTKFLNDNESYYPKGQKWKEFDFLTQHI